MEKLKEVMDAETLESRYLFPGTPYDKSYLARLLWYRLEGFDSFEDEDLSFYVEHAFYTSINKKAKGHPEVNLSFDLVNHLLRTQPCYRLDGRKVDPETVLDGKYIMACSLPVPDSWASPSVRDAAIKSNELYVKRQHDFEMIIVASVLLIDEWEKYANLDRHFRTFHPSCIIIPLYPEIEDSLNLRALKIRDAIVVDPDHKVLVNSHVTLLSQYGSSAFPFTDQISTLWKYYLNRKHSSLEDILGLGPSFEVFRVVPGTDDDHSLPQLEYKCVSHFKSKVVFFYLFKRGFKMSLLRRTVKFLKKLDIEFEIVTAYVPSPIEYFNPLEFPEVFSRFIAENGFPGWVVPYESSMYPRLKSLYGCAGDQLIVFDPKLNEGDPHGCQIMTAYDGHPSVFPFIKMSTVEYIMKELTQVTLQYLLDPITTFYMEGHSCEDYACNKSMLKGKNVLVYFDSIESDYLKVFNPFNSRCKTLGAEKRDFELVFVCLSLFGEVHGSMFDSLRLPFPRWLVHPADELALSKHVAQKFFMKLFKHEFSTVIAFGKDGKICSMLAHNVVSSSCKAGTFPFDDCDLAGEVYKIVDDYCNYLYDGDDRMI